MGSPGRKLLLFGAPAAMVGLLPPAPLLRVFFFTIFTARSVPHPHLALVRCGVGGPVVYPRFCRGHAARIARGHARGWTLEGVGAPSSGTFIPSVGRSEARLSAQGCITRTKRKLRHSTAGLKCGGEAESRCQKQFLDKLLLQGASRLNLKRLASRNSVSKQSIWRLRHWRACSVSPGSNACDTADRAAPRLNFVHVVAVSQTVRFIVQARKLVFPGSRPSSIDHRATRS